MSDGMTEAAGDPGQTSEQVARDKLRRECSTDIDSQGPQLKIDVRIGSSALLRMKPYQRTMIQQGLAMVEAALHAQQDRASMANSIDHYLQEQH